MEKHGNMKYNILTVISNALSRRFSLILGYSNAVISESMFFHHLHKNT